MSRLRPAPSGHRDRPHTTAGDGGVSHARRLRHRGGGLLLALGDISPQDYRAGVSRDSIVHESLRSVNRIAPDAGSVIVLHDAGGNRRRTVDALEVILEGLADRRFEAVTVTEFADLVPIPPRERTLADKAAYLGLTAMLRVGQWIDGFLGMATTILLITGLVRSVAVIALARLGRQREQRSDRAPVSEQPVTVIVPAYNEETGILQAIRSILRSDHDEVEVIVVDDGSTDRTRMVVNDLIDDLGDKRSVRLLTQANGGKSAALNLGILHAEHEIVVLVDGDTIFEPSTIGQLVAPLSDPEVGAVGGNVKVGNRRGVLGAWQHVEYVCALNIERRALDVLGCAPTIPGAIGAFRRDAVLAEGGVPSNTLAEDTDLTIALHRAGWRVAFAPEARAWTEVPTTFKALWSQRYRWTHGIFQSLWKHRAALVEEGPGGRFARRAFPYLLTIPVLSALIAPAIDVFAVVGLLTGNPGEVIVLWGGLQLMAIVVAAYAFRIEGESLKPLWLIPFQQFGHRQLMYGVILRSIGTALSGTRLGWQKLDRSGGVEVHQTLRAIEARE